MTDGPCCRICLSPEPRHACKVRASYRQRGNGWEGVVREGKAVIIACGHYHRNRDESSMTNGRAALACASDLLEGMQWGDRWITAVRHYQPQSAAEADAIRMRIENIRRAEGCASAAHT